MLHFVNLMKFLKKTKDDLHNSEVATMKFHEKHNARVHEEIDNQATALNHELSQPGNHLT